MDYSEILIRMDQRLQLYHQLVNKKDFEKAKVTAIKLMELASELLSVTREMK